MDRDGLVLGIRTASPADLPELQRVYRAASLSNPGDALMLLARPEYLAFTGDGIAAGRTRLAHAGPDETGRVLGFATASPVSESELELDDLFVDPPFQRRGVARRLVVDAARSGAAAGFRRILVTANPHARSFYLAAGFVDGQGVTTPLGEGRRMRLDLA
ncbi:GNAT family N-acetyltransferase [Actinotalea sp. M2MS4P-6]|uniref:GNAT family N-acetyltransferase n=1 Tax=Actinotalea sp. M2MS4P-6 TaxID=2983762 RepID=UPI0021E435C8|nr:GNAT family N-acetyltransferase [Actinotalea sp. M2MS4P-6]MCV2396254.1 GNAT family N-acetyltransferase [Actinotalea sp. M2MS4P-6]